MQGRIAAGAGLALDVAAATSRHWPARREGMIAVLCEPSDANAARLTARREGAPLGGAELRPDGSDTARLVLDAPLGTHPDDADLVAVLAEAAFQRCPGAVRLRVADGPALLGLATDRREGEALVDRAAFHQLPLLWGRPAATAYPLLRAAPGSAQGRPLRPPRPTGTFYRRWLPRLGTTLSLRAIDRRRDLALFHGWMNQERVAHYWDLAGSEAALDRYLAEQEADPHLYGVIGAFDDEPVAYFEVYWAKEDRLGPHYDAEDFDRGWHGLVGDPRHLGRPRTQAWFTAVTHCLFLDEPRTRRIMGEPRATHRKMLSYCATTAYAVLKEFDFPHKRAALVCCERERFFREVPL
ncbi:GNAT family N-acetyltransferase [Methylobacterium sp. WSM2598]|uniref:GNAT family N-acetyltransferase n=1 Tax=Methylobacterium sp. WSM2598 TaxID=398261 RepID=UPI00039E9E05|nr:GNAT family N-acetyltransferase [Methylobacterium sp. WSM2598]